MQDAIAFHDKENGPNTAALLPTPGSGKAHPANLVTLGPARFSVLGPGLIRLEYSPLETFEDRASFFAVQRNAPPQAFKHWSEAGTLHLETTVLHLRYRPDGLPFHAGNLGIDLKAAPGGSWRPDLVSTGNLGGTLRTLDNCEGPESLGDGLLSRDGWYLKDDSATVLYSADADPWVAPRPEGGLDWYFFGYGLDYPAALRAMTGLSGPIPLPPYWSLGSWYSRYWPYHAHEFLEIAEQYREHGFPLDVMVVDMDWHRQGWTGYSWNHELIPDPDDLLRRLHGLGLRVTLNLHPHAGVGPHEDAYADFAKALGQDPAAGQTVPFDVTNRAFMREYFKLLLHPLEAQGVDFWWMDWQQGTTSVMPGLDPLTWLNDLHYRDRERPGNRAFPGPASPVKRGMGFSRWSGWGDHRHPVQFSGDTHSNWEVLEFLPQFTATAGNVGVAYWSHDLGGHFPSGRQVDPELYLRWLQFGALSPVMRIHSAADPLNDRRPWLYGKEFESAARLAFALRAQLVPYLYGAARQCFESGMPLLRPLYLHYADQPKAYEAGHQYLLGPDLLVAGAARPGFGPRRVLHAQVWFPEGEWYHWDTLERFVGPLETMVPTPLEGLPLFVRGGAPLCTQEAGRDRACAMDASLVLRVLPGPAAERELYEDDGESVDYKAGAFRKTKMATKPLPWGRQQLSLGPSVGDFRGDGLRRPWIVELPVGTTVSTAAGAIQSQSEAEGRLRIVLAPWSSGGQVELILDWNGSGLGVAAHDAFRSLARRCVLAAEQLDVGHPIRMDLGGWAGAAKIPANLELEKSKLRTMTQVLVSEGRSSEAAIRILAGVSLLAHAQNGPDGALTLQVELRRDAEAVASQHGPCVLRWRIGSDPWAVAEWIPGGACLSHSELPLKADRAHLGWLAGELVLELELDGQRLELTEGFAWDGRAVKDWMVLGPHAVDQAPEPAASAEEWRPDAVLAGLAECSLAWKAHRFNPSRVARDVRHFYNLGSVFQCKDGACSAVAMVQAKQGGSAECEFYHDGKARLWLNGVELDLSRGHRQPVTLKSGNNLFWVRLFNVIHQGRGLYLAMHSTDGGARGLRFCLPDGVPLPDRKA